MGINIRGYIGGSLLDYPPYISSVISIGGCNMHCEHCHSKHMNTPDTEVNSIDFSIVKELIKRHMPYTDAIVFTGGEPSIHVDKIKQIIAEINGIKKFKYKVFSNGLNVYDLLQIPEINYVTISIKDLFCNYYKYMDDDGNIEDRFVYIFQVLNHYVDNREDFDYDINIVETKMNKDNIDKIINDLTTICHVPKNKISVHKEWKHREE